MKLQLALASLALFAATAIAAPQAYDEAADAKAQVSQALADAKASKQPVLLIFGANWCPDCVALDNALKTGKNAELMAREFKVVKVDVGNFNKNTDIAAAYGNPIKKGIPAAVVVSPDNQVLYATRAGELSNARRMSETGVHDFFAKVVATTREKR